MSGTVRFRVKSPNTHMLVFSGSAFVVVSNRLQIHLELGLFCELCQFHVMYLFQIFSCNMIVASHGNVCSSITLTYFGLILMLFGYIFSQAILIVYIKT